MPRLNISDPRLRGTLGLLILKSSIVNQRLHRLYEKCGRARGPPLRDLSLDHPLNLVRKLNRAHIPS